MSDGVLYVEIMPSTKGIGKAVERDATAAFAGAEKTGKSFFQRLGGWAKAGAIAVGGMVAAVGALAIGGGISRALNIEDAQAKLKGLGHDTKAVEAIMNNALASVKGTAFGLDTAATVAATAVAAGIKPGQELEKYLRLTADAATIAGVSMEEMGSILNKATTAGKVYTQELNQLADRGLPIFQWLQEEYGVTAEELRKMVAAGEVDAETFRKVIEDNIGGAALAAGDTTRGAFANMRAAMSRFGAALVGPDGLGAAKTFFNEVTVIFDGLTDRVGPWVEKIQEKLGSMFQIEGMGERFLDWLDDTAAKIANGPIPQLLDALAPILPVIAEAAALIGSALGDAFRELGEALAPVLPMLAETLADAVVELAPPLTELLIALLPLIPAIVDLAVALVPLIVALVDFLLPAITWVIEKMTEVSGVYSGFAELLSGDQSIMGFVSKILQLEGPFGDLIRWVAGASAAFGDFMRSVGDAMTSVWNTIVGTLTGIVAFFRSSWENISSTVSTGVQNVVTFVQTLPARITAAVAGFGFLLFSAGRDLIQGLINGVSSMIDDAVNAVKNVGGQMLDSVKSFLGIASPSRVFRDEVGKMIGLGLLEGVENAAIAGRIDTAVQHLVDVPAVAGSGGFAFPDTVTLVDRDGSILGLMDVRIGSAFPSDAGVSSRLGVRRLV